MIEEIDEKLIVVQFYNDFNSKTMNDQTHQKNHFFKKNFYIKIRGGKSNNEIEFELNPIK